MQLDGLFEDAANPSVCFARVTVAAAIVIEPDVVAVALRSDGSMLGAFKLRDQIDAIWLPRGQYLVRMTFAHAGSGAAGTVHLRLHCKQAGVVECLSESSTAPKALTGELLELAARMGERDGIRSLSGSKPIAELSWAKAGADWFHRHFDHAARTIGSYILGDSELLRGDVLDVGCGDGITDLGFALHYGPRLMVGLDPFRGFARLPEILEQNGVPRDAVPPSLRFVGHDGNHLPFPDDSFDVVISWGSLEHIAGGYRQCLREVKRVLRDGGLFFVNPGLFFSNVGHHLGEFSSEPFFHLKMTEAELRDKVLNGSPQRMDRSGLEATPAEYWQWYKELNPITVTDFERELRAHDFDPWRVALRTESLIEYTPELLKYPIQDLATTELYMSCRNRKLSRPADYAQRPPEEFQSELAP